jgi:two-component system NtrC family sensor kinase
MKDFKLPESMQADEKATLLQQLQSLIEQTYSVEKEYVALRSSYNQLQGLVGEIIEALPNALWVLNSDGSVFLQNSAAQALGGMLEHIDLGDQEAEVPYHDRHFLIKISHSDEKRIVSATDITEQKRKERLASMGQMAAHLAHEIRNPIGSIALLISSLSRRVVPKNQPIVDEIKRSLFRVERIIKTTLLYSKGVQPHFTKIPLKKLEMESQAAVESYSYTKEIHFHYAFEDATIEGDLGLLSLALQNFIFNAIDAIEESDDESGDVYLRTEIDKKSIRFVIEDSGIAVPDPDRLFEAFHTTKTKGNGLGLALARQIVQAHHGRIDIETDPKRFIITLERQANS